jgi:hypothetical protein
VFPTRSVPRCYKQHKSIEFSEYERPSIFIKEKPIFSSERMLHKGYDYKSSVEKNLLSWVSRGLTPRRNGWRQTANRKVTLTLGEGTPRKLATATQPQFPRTVISLSWTHITEWSSAYWGNDNTVASVSAALFSNMCSTQADNSSRKLRLRCGCHFPWCALALLILIFVSCETVAGQ